MKNGCGLTQPTLRIRGMRYYYGICTSTYLASERSERDIIRGVQIRAGAVRIYIYIYLLVMYSYSTIMASELDQHNYKL